QSFMPNPDSLTWQNMSDAEKEQARTAATKYSQIYSDYLNDLAPAMIKYPELFKDGTLLTQLNTTMSNVINDGSLEDGVFWHQYFRDADKPEDLQGRLDNYNRIRDAYLQTHPGAIDMPPLTLDDVKQLYYSDPLHPDRAGQYNKLLIDNAITNSQ